jgi:PAS domain S-box-containing protein
MSDRIPDQTAWESERIEELGGALITAASAAGIGVSLVSMVPPAARAVYVSDKGVEILGHPREVLLSRPASDFLTPEERGHNAYDPRREPREPVGRFFETVVERASGERVPIEVSIAPIRLDGLPGIIAFMRDISERRRTVAALERSERHFRQLIEIAPDAVWINDGRRLTYANPAAASMLAYDSVEELLTVDPLDIVAPEEHGKMRERTQQMVRSGVPMEPREYKSRRKDGSWVIAEVQSMPMEWDGKPAILGLARDVTSRKQMEARLAQSERLAALGTLLAGIAHEVNNPLSYTLLGIEQGLAALDQAATPSGETAKLREALESAHHGATRVAAIVGQIRASSRSDVEERGPVELRRVLEAALRVAQNEIHHRARLVTQLADVPALMGSAQRLEQVFLNLLVNAVQALPDGRAENEIRVSLARAATGEVIVEVADNGPGIAEDVRSRIFDPFFTTKPVGIGLGLGLSICHGIVSAHGGTIAVESAPGRGTTFRVALPGPGDPPGSGQQAGGPKSGGEGGGGGPRRRRVLVIDDEPALASMIRRVLSKDCDVDVAIDAREGLALLVDGGEYDVVLCDLMMPDMTGMDLYAEIARRRPGVERRFVFMTGGAFTPRASEFLAQIKNRRLEKPFETAALKAAVAQDD